MIRLSLAANSLRLWWNAWRDARQETPAVDSAHLSETERRLVDFGRLATRRVTRHAVQRLALIRAELARTSAARDLAASRFDAVAIGNDAGRTTSDRRLPWWIATPALVVLAVVDMWFNKTAFDSLGEAGGASLGLALMLGVGLPLLADVFGTQLRQERWTRGRVLAWTVILSVVCATLVGTAVLRIQVPMIMGEGAGDGGGAVVMTLPETSRVPEAPAHSSLSPRALFWLFLTLNVFLFAVAAFIGAFAADSRRGFALMDRALKRLTRRVERLQHEETRLTALLEQQEALVSARVRERIRYYRQVHRRWRRASPRYFDDPSHGAHDPAHVLDPAHDEVRPENTSAVRRAPEVTVTTARASEVRWSTRSGPRPTTRTERVP